MAGRLPGEETQGFSRGFSRTIIMKTAEKFINQRGSLTQDQAAAAIGSPLPIYRYWEDGRLEPPEWLRKIALAKLSKAAGTRLVETWDGCETPEQVEQYVREEAESVDILMAKINQPKQGLTMEKEHIITIIQRDTTADTHEKAVSVYTGLFDQVDYSKYTRTDVLNYIREARSKGDTQCAVFAPDLNVAVWQEDGLYCALSEDYPGANGLGSSVEDAIRDLREAWEFLEVESGR